MCKKKDNIEGKKPRNCTIIMIWVIMVIIAAAVVCCICGFFFNIFEYDNKDNIVITFLGALAAFVVISNYAQMVEVRNQTDKRIKELESKLEAMSTTIDEKVRVTDTDKTNISNKYETMEKIMFCDQGILFRYYAIKDSTGYKMLKTRGYSEKDIDEIEFKEYLRRFSDNDMRESEKKRLKNFGIPDNLLNK